MELAPDENDFEQYDDEMPAEMTLDEIGTPLFGGGNLSTWIADMESLLGLVIVSFVGLVVLGLGGFAYLMWEWRFGAFHIPIGERILLTVAWAMGTFFEALSIRFIGRAMQWLPYPRPVSMALAQKDRGVAADSLLALWWLAHGVAVVVIVDWILRKYGPGNSMGAGTLIDLPMRGMWFFGSMYASTAFLLLSFGTIWANEKMLRRVWKARVPIDIAITLALLWIFPNR